MTYLMVVPVVSNEVMEGFVSGLRLPHENVLVVDNGIPPAWTDWDGPHYNGTGRNWGVATSWNAGAKIVLEQQRDWLIIASSAVRWGKPGGTDFIEGLELCEGHPAVSSGLGWHLCAIHRTTLELVGLFDENFWPGFFEDTDYLYRMHLAGLPSPRENGEHWGYVPCDAEYGQSAHSLDVDFVFREVHMGFLSYLYQRKWGGKQGHETYETPWGVPGYPIWKWPAPNHQY